MEKEFKFFIYLLEFYAKEKKTTPAEVLRQLEQKNLVTFVYDMYERYHSEAIENACQDIDELLMQKSV